MAVTEHTPLEHEDPSDPPHPGAEPVEPTVLDADTIRRRAYEISQHDDGGSPEQNWYRAEAELVAARAAQLAAAEEEEATALLHAKLGAYGHP